MGGVTAIDVIQGKKIESSDMLMKGWANWQSYECMRLM